MGMASVANRTSNLTQTQACWELVAGSAARAAILELSIVQATATAQSLGFGRPQAIGITPAGGSTPVRDEPGEPACTAVTALSWGTSPTVPLVFARRWNSAATVGVGVVWTWPRAFVIAVDLSAVIWNITTALASDVCCAYFE